MEPRGAVISAAIAARVEAVPPRSANRPREQLLAVFAWLDDWLRSPGFQGCLFVRAASEYPHPDDLPHGAAESFKLTGLGLLEGLCVELPCPQPALLARQLEILIEGATMVAFQRGDADAGIRARQAAALLIDAALSGGEGADPGA